MGWGVPGESIIPRRYDWSTRDIIYLQPETTTFFGCFFKRPYMFKTTIKNGLFLNDRIFVNYDEVQILHHAQCISSSWFVKSYTIVYDRIFLETTVYFSIHDHIVLKRRKTMVVFKNDQKIIKKIYKVVVSGCRYRINPCTYIRLLQQGVMMVSKDLSLK